jgi:hypothetical protein
MPNPPILSVETVDWTYDDVAEELEHLAMIEDLEPSSGPSLADLPSLLLDDDLLRVTGGARDGGRARGPLTFRAVPRRV